MPGNRLNHVPYTDEWISRASDREPVFNRLLRIHVFQHIFDRDIVCRFIDRDGHVLPLVKRRALLRDFFRSSIAAQAADRDRTDRYARKRIGI